MLTEKQVTELRWAMDEHVGGDVDREDVYLAVMSELMC